LVLDESQFSQPTGLVRGKREPRHSGVLLEALVSFYATVTGYIRYRTLACLEAAVGRLQTGGWLDNRQRWQIDGRVIEHGRIETIDTDQLVLVIPPRLYRHLARITTRLFVGATDGVVVISSTDGCFDGWIERPLPAAAAPTPSAGAITSIEAIDLEAFARKSGIGVKRFEQTPPDEYAAWQDRVCLAFHDTFDPPLPPDLADQPRD
jgi:hypothetical protein